MAFLEIKGIKKSFGKTEVLKGIDFSMEKGEVLAIIGSSGSGKTTLLRSINFLERPDEGTMSVNGETIFDAADTRRYSDSEIREKRLHFGLVFQSFNLFPQYNVLKNISLAPQLLRLKDGKRRIPKAERVRILKEIDAKSLELLNTVGLAEKALSYPCELSGGQQQRVLLARALCATHKLLLLDEPVSGLDPMVTAEMYELIDGINKSGVTVIMVTHDISAALKYANTILCLRSGEWFFGTRDEFLQSSAADFLKGGGRSE